MPACNLRLQWKDILWIQWSGIAGLIASFLMCTLRSTDMQPHGRFDRIKGEDGNQKVVCFEAQSSTVTSSEKKRKINLKPVSLYHSPSPGSASSPLLIVTPSADTAKLKDCSCVFTKASSLSSPVWAQAIPSALPPFENNLQSGEEERKKGEKKKREKTPLGSEIALSHKKPSLLR